MDNPSRREFLQRSLGIAAGAWSASCLLKGEGWSAPSQMALGLVTYQWGKDWDLPTLIANCQAASLSGVELRTTHRHGVEPVLSDEARAEVKRRFEDSSVANVGIGSDERFDAPDPDALRRAIEAVKAFVRLSHDTGGTGVKVKPNSFHEGVEREVTIAQIARSLDEVGKFAGEWGQEIRLEVHGSCGPIPIIKTVMDQVRNPNVGVCWNSNGDELQGEGLEHHFHLIADRLGATCHVRELDSPDYPYQDLLRLLAKRRYAGWILLECSSSPQDTVQAMREQKVLFDAMMAKAAAG